MKLTPFFITNDAWYTYDDENEMWVLTDKAPLEAVKSYEEYYAEDDVRLEGLEELRENPEKAHFCLGPNFESPSARTDMPTL